MPPIYAAAAPQGADPTAGLISTLIFFGAILLIFYVMIIRPQVKRQKEHQKMLSELKKGDRIVTTAGIHGTVTDIEDSVVVLQIADNTRIRLEKSAIATVLKK
ncbi:MAG: preprotein translocase subunit YajC [Candidatus Kapabacteria bacterium]|nr:preprotein translocase subunit YajC [Candidatus Kapabacteria bacterium]MCS7169560.1 preprotein translocase subunit YajC [Candidatus Kapabacteria bacterium]MDW7997797.1 preprotein translocase subunit YajC [Bacteroidota bacterium]MDW8225053.1 preprotein translocase subunit YajC [Bacteroidota bacterium]